MGRAVRPSSGDQPAQQRWSDAPAGQRPQRRWSDAPAEQRPRRRRSDIAVETPAEREGLRYWSKSFQTDSGINPYSRLDELIKLDEGDQAAVHAALQEVEVEPDLDRRYKVRGYDLYEVFAAVGARYYHIVFAPEPEEPQALRCLLFILAEPEREREAYLLAQQRLMQQRRRHTSRN